MPWPGRTVRLYVSNHVLGDAVADDHGVWTLAPAKDLPPGIYQLRTDELAASGKVMARSEVPFARASLTQVLAPGQAVVQPGDCLWTIAPAQLRPWCRLYGDLRREPRPDPRSRPNLSGPGLPYADVQ